MLKRLLSFFRSFCHEANEEFLTMNEDERRAVLEFINDTI